jgi:hypothetical protein
MKFFYQRNETEEQVQITLSSFSFYLTLALVGFWLLDQFLLNTVVLSDALMPILAIFVFTRFFFILKVQKEVMVAMKAGRVRTVGSKFSFSNPFTYFIEK